MRPSYFRILNIMGFLLFQALIAGFQTALWTVFFGQASAPVLWITPILYFALYRETREGIIFCYLSSFVLSHYTSMSFAMISLVTLSVYFTARFVKTRIFWPGTSYFVVTHLGAIVLMHVYHLIFSKIAEYNPVTSLYLSSLAWELVISPPLGIACLAAFRAMDRLLTSDVGSPTGVPQ